MNELKRLAYLQAMGTDTYISLRQLPGAAPTRRLAIVRKLPPAATALEMGDGIAELDQLLQAPPARATAIRSADPELEPVRSPAAEVSLRFSLAAVSCGGWLWLEEIGRTPFSQQQLQLLQALTGALGFVAGQVAAGVAKPPELAQFNWPIHSNRQLDLGEEAARASAAGFIQRKLDTLDCHGLVLLGQSCASRVALDQLDCARLLRTVSTSAMLQDPLLKRQAWQDLRPFFQQA